MRKKQNIKRHLLLLTFSLLAILIADYLSLSNLVTGQTVNPEVTLAWSADSYIPPGYPGKALPARGSFIEVAAHIDSKEINPREVIYNWFLGDHFQEAGSGQGKQVFRFGTEGSLRTRYFAKVEIKNKEGALLAFSSYLPIELQEPQIVLRPSGYLLKLEPTLLISPKYQISTNQEMEFIAQPYFFNINQINELNYNWSLGRKEAAEISLKKPNVFLLKVGLFTQSISRDLQVWAENKNNPLQRAQTKVEIIFTP